MKHYLLSIQQPDGGPPPAEFLEPIMRDVDAFNKELEAAGAWVFGGGLHEPSTATVVRLEDGEVLTTDGVALEIHRQSTGCLAQWTGDVGRRHGVNTLPFSSLACVASQADKEMSTA